MLGLSPKKRTKSTVVPERGLEGMISEEVDDIINQHGVRWKQVFLGCIFPHRVIPLVYPLIGLFFHVTWHATRDRRMFFQV